MRINEEDYKKYTLLNKNVPVLDFLYDEETHNVLKILDVVNKDYAPLNVVDYKTGISRKSLNEWWRNRSIPASRNNINRIMEQLRIDSTMELLEKCLGFSLSDQYWVKLSDSQAKWKDLNFFDNEFSEDIGKILLGQIEPQINLNLISPDNASDGDLTKKWKIINDQRYLIKGGNSLNNQEPFNEVVATKLYENILESDEYVEYSLIEEDGQFYSACETMVSSSEELVSALAIDSTKKLYGNDSLYEHYISCCDELGIKDARNKVNKMLVCDYILANYDRHYRNFGAIRNVETLEWVKIAPIYDSGNSLWARTPTMEISSVYKSKPFKKDPKEQLKLVKDLTWLNIEKLIGFEKTVAEILSQNPLMEKSRIDIICNHVKSRIKDVIELKKELEKNKKLDFMIDKAIAIKNKKEQVIDENMDADKRQGMLQNKKNEER